MQCASETELSSHDAWGPDLTRPGKVAHLEAASEAEGELCRVLEGAREVAEGSRQVQLVQVRHSWRLKVVASLDRTETRLTEIIVLLVQFFTERPGSGAAEFV